MYYDVHYCSITLNNNALDTNVLVYVSVNEKVIYVKLFLR